MGVLLMAVIHCARVMNAHFTTLNKSVQDALVLLQSSSAMRTFSEKSDSSTETFEDVLSDCGKRDNSVMDLGQRSVVAAGLWKQRRIMKNSPIGYHRPTRLSAKAHVEEVAKVQSKRRKVQSARNIVPLKQTGHQPKIVHTKQLAHTGRRKTVDGVGSNLRSNPKKKFWRQVTSSAGCWNWLSQKVIFFRFTFLLISGITWSVLHREFLTSSQNENGSDGAEDHVCARPSVLCSPRAVSDHNLSRTQRVWVHLMENVALMPGFFTSFGKLQLQVVCTAQLVLLKYQHIMAAVHSEDGCEASQRQWLLCFE